MHATKQKSSTSTPGIFVARVGSRERRDESSISKKIRSEVDASKFVLHGVRRLNRTKICVNERSLFNVEKRDEIDSPSLFFFSFSICCQRRSARVRLGASSDLGNDVYEKKQT